MFAKVQASWLERALFFLVIVAPLPCLVNFHSIAPDKLLAPTISVTTGLDLKESRDFLLKEYDNVVTEIRLRIEQEHLLLLLKFSVVGAVLGLIFRTYKIGESQEGQNAFQVLQQSTGAAVCCWAAIAVAAIVDVRINFNANLIVHAGYWVRGLENALLAPQNRAGWEQWLAQSELRTSYVAPFLLADRQLLTWVLYVVTLGVFVPREGGGQSLQALNIARTALPVCYIVFWFVGINFYFQAKIGIYSAGCVLAVTFTLWWIHHIRRMAGERLGPRTVPLSPQ